VQGHAADSLVYDARRRFLFHYKESQIVYQSNDLKADHIIVNAGTKEVFGVGMPDSVGVMTRPEFVQGGSNYTMDTVVYNLGTSKALIKGVATKDGEGYMLARVLKKQKDNTIDMADAKYTTCDRIDHPHFYIAMNASKVVPGKKIITGPAYFVMEDVPLPAGIPGGFFPLFAGPTSGLVMPTYGEEANRGFYFRDGGYYFTFGDNFDLKLTGDIYTLGSWAVKGQSNYIKRYKYRGGVNITYNKLIMGDEVPASNQFAVTWNHSQDPKANPWRTFSANVNFSTAGQKQMATTSLQDNLNTNTTSTVQYTRRWQVGSTTVNMSAQLGLNTSSRDSTISVTLPNISLSVGSFAPLKRKAGVGKERWYEKITMSYSMQAMNQAMSVKEYDFFGSARSKNSALGRMQNGVSHSIPIKTSFNILNYINFSPSLDYREVWSFKRQYRSWDPAAGGGNGAVNTDMPIEYGFFRTYSWNTSGSFSTKLYGTFQTKEKPGKVKRLQAIRHTLTPTMSFTYAPDFRHPRYGFAEYVQSSATGSYQQYSPYQGSPAPLSGAAPQASVSFSLSNRLEVKLRDRADSTKKKNVVIIEQLSVSSNYNFLLKFSRKDEFPLGTFPVSLRTGELFKGFAIQLSGTWDPYQYINDGGTARRVNKLNVGGGKFGRITQTSWSMGKTFSSKNGSSPAPGSINGSFVTPYEDPYDMTNGLDPATRRQYMVQGYYDFNVPWSFTFNYNVSYNYTGLKPKITQTLGFNGSLTLGKWGSNFNSGYDFTRRKLSHMQLNFTRDLHCWEMSFQWVPMGRIKQYSFHIGVKSGMLRDIKYDKSSNMYDTLMR